MASGKQTVKTAIALVGLLGAGAFTFTRVLGGSENAAKAERGPSEEPQRHAEPSPSEPKTTSGEPSTPETSQPKALTWDDYLRYDPFEGRGSPTPEIVALAAGPSPFYAETIVASQGTGKGMSPVEKYTLGAILGTTGARIAVVDNHPYRVGEYLLSKDGERMDDAEVGSIRVMRIEADHIEVHAAGMTFSLKLPVEEQALVRAVGDAQKNSPKK